MTCPTISPAVRLRTSFCVPVWQKEQVSVQPTWRLTHSVPRFSRDIDGLDLVSAGDADICGAVFGTDRRVTISGSRFRTFRPERRGILWHQVGHLREIAHAPVIDPYPIWPTRILACRSGVPAAIRTHAQLVAGQADDIHRRLPAACVERSAGPG